MSVMEKVSTTGVMMSSISGEASEELKAINEDCRANALERADERRREEADRETANQAQLRADNPLETESSEEYEVDADPSEPIERRA